MLAQLGVEQLLIFLPRFGIGAFFGVRAFFSIGELFRIGELFSIGSVQPNTANEHPAFRLLGVPPSVEVVQETLVLQNLDSEWMPSRSGPSIFVNTSGWISLFALMCLRTVGILWAGSKIWSTSTNWLKSPSSSAALFSFAVRVC